MAQVKNKLRGEYTYPSDFSEIPDGGLLLGQNINVDRDSIGEPRRGFNTYKQISSTGTDRGKSLMSYRDTLIASYESDLSRDGSNPFTHITGTFATPDHGGSYRPKIKGVEANRNFYFITKAGIKKMTSAVDTPTQAGAPRGLDLSAALNAGLSGFMSDDTQVAYRIIWGYKDANENLILGAPSGRATVANTSGGTKDVDLSSTIPAEVTTSWFYQIYRSGQSQDALTEPNDELQLVIEDNPTSAQISAKVITVTDSTPDDLRGATIYTAPSQQGIAQANDTPPAGKDICVFRNMGFISNTIQKQQFPVTLLSVDGTSGISFVSETGDVTISSAVIINIGDTSQMHAGQSITGTGIQAGSKILTVDSPTQITMTLPATATNAAVVISVFDTITIAGTSYKGGASEVIASAQFEVFTSGTPAQNIADTAQSLIRVIDRYTGNTSVYAYYNSGFDQLPGQIFIQSRTLGVTAFTVQAFGHSDAWSPNLTTAQSSNAEEKRHRLHVSKLQQYEAYPLLQYFDIGAADKEILRIIALRDVCIICKEDGFWRAVGDTPSTLQIEPIDLTTFLIAPESAVALANQVHAFTTQGFSTVNDTGIGVISRAIENQINPLYGFANVKTAVFGLAYETDRSYLCWVPESGSDTFPSIVHRYNVFTQQWTKWDKAARAAIVNPADDKIYYMDADTNYIFKERKDRSYTDYTDEDLSVTISSVVDTAVTLSALLTTINEGDALTQSPQPYAIVTDIDNTGATTVLTIDVAREFVPGAAIIKKAYECNIKFTAQFCGNAGMMKHIREIQPEFKRAEFTSATLEFQTDIKTATEELDITGFASFLWGYFGWGEVPWGGIQTISKDRALIPGQYQRCSWIISSFVLNQAYGYFELAGMQYTFEWMSERTQNG